MYKLIRTQKCSILGSQNLGSRGGPGPRAPLYPHLQFIQTFPIPISSIKEIYSVYSRDRHKPMSDISKLL